MTDDKLIEDIYIKLLDYYGPQSWWPADSPFEVMLGAILTQNTNWNNVEKALDNLKPYMQPQIIYAMDMDKLKVLIKPSGFYNIKAKRIKNFLEWFKGYNFSLERLKQIDMYTLRRELLTISGIGKETADSILLYALNMPIFVIDAYTRRMFSRLGIAIPKKYDEVQRLFHTAIDENTDVYNEYHALIVCHSKRFCRKKPDCNGCFLKNICDFYTHA